jgi:hypothetical protein
MVRRAMQDLAFGQDEAMLIGDGDADIGGGGEGAASNRVPLTPTL